MALFVDEMMIRIILISLIMTSPQMLFSQGPLDGFIDAPKSKNLALSYNRESAKTYFLADRDINFPSNFNSISVFYKHQLTKWLGVAVNVPLVSGKLQDGNLFLKFGQTFKINDDFSLNGILGVGISHPLSDYNTENANAIGQQAQSLSARIITQLTYKNALFLNLRVGHDETKLPTPSSNLYSLKVGYYKDKWYTDLWFQNVTALGGKDYLGVGDLRPDSFRELGVSNAQIGGVVYHQTKEKIGFFVSGAQIIGGRNTRANFRISVGGVVKL